MTKEQMEKWVAALRSGKYAQTDGRLRDINNDDLTISFCCLGVLADIRGVDWSNRLDFARGSDEILNDDWCGISESWQNRLASLNDGGRNFNHIADVIACNYQDFEGDFRGPSYDPTTF